RSALLDADDLAGQAHLGAEGGGVRDRTPGQVGTGQPLREPEIVLDRGALTGLAAGRLTLHDDGTQALRRPVHRSRQARWTATHDAYVIQRPARGGTQPESVGKIENRRRAKRVALWDENQREIGGGRRPGSTHPPGPRQPPTFLPTVMRLAPQHA